MLATFPKRAIRPDTMFQIFGRKACENTSADRRLIPTYEPQPFHCQERACAQSVNGPRRSGWRAVPLGVEKHGEVGGYSESPDEKSIGRSVRFLRRTYRFQDSELAMLGLFVTLSGVRKLGAAWCVRRKRTFAP